MTLNNEIIPGLQSLVTSLHKQVVIRHAIQSLSKFRIRDFRNRLSDLYLPATCRHEIWPLTVTVFMSGERGLVNIYKKAYVLKNVKNYFHSRKKS